MSEELFCSPVSALVSDESGDPASCPAVHLASNLWVSGSPFKGVHLGWPIVKNKGPGVVPGPFHYLKSLLSLLYLRVVVLLVVPFTVSFSFVIFILTFFFILFG